ncbi:hypothetical protein K505DRAFT_242652 [Melanomma pulvis-pyrius CBS 109.77]|uniref:EthD domain-containing protein n=1 Tax=Melanomma pulvis-pyrius CBS 109.77 TaxID=1314802 RepID=A0A6A6XE61_9PLEO|nr:hypothetical protein K505DRAFT_242652 [Melanomma pulvis-pyrius CBS 109.77]
MSETTPPIQIIGYLKRHPSLTREQFYAHWKNNHAPIVLPFFKKYGTICYQQIHASGLIVPNSDPENSSTEAIEFDGIAMTLIPSMDAIAKRSDDPYFTEVIEPDEARFLDRDSPGKGIIAIFYGQSESFIEPEVKGEKGGDDKK